MRRGGGFALVLAALAVLAVPASVLAQRPPVLSVQGFSGQAGGSFDGSWNYWSRSGEMHTTSWREWASLTVNGAVVHPKLVSFRLSARPELVQGTYLPRVDSVSGDAGGNRFSGDARVEFFPGFEIGGAVYAWRTDGYQRQRYGGSTEGTATTWGAEIHDQNPLLPARVTYERRLRDQDTYYPVNGVRISRVEDVSAFRYRAQNSKTALSFEKVIRRDPSVARNFERTAAQLRHTLTWGKGSTLRSALRYNGRGGGVDARTFSWAEAASLRQARSFWTNLGTSFGRQSAQSGSGSYREGSAGVRYRPDRRLDLGLGGFVRRERQVTFAQDRARLGPSGNFMVELPAGLSLTANFNVWYEWRTDRAEAGFPVDVIQEAQVVGPAGSFRLDQPFVLEGSVFVASEDGTEVFREGVDYFLVEDGPYLEVHVLPGAELAAGDAVVVDYRYRLQGSLGTRATGISSGLRVRRRSWSVYANHSRNRVLDDLPSGSTLGLRDVERLAGGMMLDVPLGRLTGTMLGEFGADRVDGGGTSYLIVRSGLTGLVYRRLMSRTSIVHQRRFLEGALNVRRLQIEESLSAPMGPYFTLQGNVSYWTWRDQGGVRSFVGLGGELEWRRGPVDGRLTYDRSRNWSRSERVEHRLFLEFSRRF